MRVSWNLLATQIGLSEKGKRVKIFTKMQGKWQMDKIIEKKKEIR